MMAFALVKPRVSQRALALGLSGGESRRVHWAAVRRHCGTGTRTEQAGAETRSSQQTERTGAAARGQAGGSGVSWPRRHMAGEWRTPSPRGASSGHCSWVPGPGDAAGSQLPQACSRAPCPSRDSVLTGGGAHTTRPWGWRHIWTSGGRRGPGGDPPGQPASLSQVSLISSPLGRSGPVTQTPGDPGVGVQAAWGEEGLGAWGRESRRENMAGGGAEAGPASGRAHQDLCAPLPSCWWLQGLPGASGPAQGRTTSPLWARGGSRQAAGGHKAGVWRPRTPSALPPPSTSRLCNPGPVLGRGRRAPALGSARAAGQTVITGNVN